MIIKLLPLALAAAVYPTLLAGVILILARPNPLRMLVGFLIGGMAISVVAGIGIVHLIEDSGVVSASHRSTKPAVDIVVGSLSLLVAWGIFRGRITGGFVKRRRQRRSHSAEPQKPSFTERTLGRGSVWMAVVAGVVLNLPGIWYLDALTTIAKANSSSAGALLQILFFNVIMFALVEIPIVLYVVNPERSAQVVLSLRDWAHRNSRPIAVTVAAGLGLYLLVRGLSNL